MQHDQKTASTMQRSKYLKRLTVGIFAAMMTFAAAGKITTAEPICETAEPNQNEKLTDALIPDFGKQKYFIRIHKQTHRLEVYEKGKTDPIKVYSCAVGKNPGDKQREGDKTTPVSWGNVIESEVGAKPKTNSAEIPFVVDEICHAKHWSHDFKDGNDVINGADGPWFISLNTGWDGIGIHGTHNPESIGTNATEGCIRLRNEDVDDLKKLLYADKKGIGVRVVITED